MEEPHLTMEILLHYFLEILILTEIAGLNRDFTYRVALFAGVILFTRFISSGNRPTKI